MGMAASQARLLTITARMHDVEYQAQSIQNAKIQLSTQSDEVYQDYLDALDATTLTIKDDNNNTITANFNNLCGINSANTTHQYAIMDDHGRLVVPDDIASSYKSFKDQGGDDAYAFAIWMLNPTAGNPETIREKLTGIEDSVASETTNLADIREKLDKIATDALGEKATKDYADDLKSGLETELSSAESAGEDSAAKHYKEALEEYNALEESYRYKLYQQNAAKIFTNKDSNGDSFGDELDFDETEFNYYVRMFNEIEEAGTCVGISSFNGDLGGDASTDSDWLKQQLTSGKFSISSVNTDKKNGKISFSTTSTATDSYVGETTTTTIDKKAYAKAEAEYEHDTKAINAKDKKYDNELSKLETEREALKTEYDSVKKVISDNIERTFGIFS